MNGVCVVGMCVCESELSCMIFIVIILLYTMVPRPEPRAPMGSFALLTSFIHTNRMLLHTQNEWKKKKNQRVNEWEFFCSILLARFK